MHSIDLFFDLEIAFNHSVHFACEAIIFSLFYQIDEVSEIENGFFLQAVVTHTVLMICQWVDGF